MNHDIRQMTVIGDLSQKQMVIKKKEDETKQERNKRRIRNRMVYNDWGLYGFVQRGQPLPAVRCGAPATQVVGYLRCTWCVPRNHYV